MQVHLRERPRNIGASKFIVELGRKRSRFGCSNVFCVYGLF